MSAQSDLDELAARYVVGSALTIDAIDLLSAAHDRERAADIAYHEALLAESGR
jgi:hypothetical protein